MTARTIQQHRQITGYLTNLEYHVYQNIQHTAQKEGSLHPN